MISEIQPALDTNDDGAVGAQTWTANYNRVVKPTVAVVWRGGYGDG
jgi:hypothetical protein